MHSRHEDRKSTLVNQLRICWIGYSRISVLKKYGANIEFVRSGKPGYVTYEDDYQIAAIPFRDTFSPW